MDVISDLQESILSTSLLCKLLDTTLHRKKVLKSDLLTGSSSVISKELSSFLESSTNGRANTNESAPDPLLSPFLGSGTHSHLRGSQQDEPSNRTAHSESTAIYSRDGGEAVG
ncbi:uncharacterized protein LOC110599881 isoform X4 [Manihot esculenta]|uniref:uncharacterized protein LOC110599881 isoform X4 n=1 Tax=Manihot esculenta TaxID=3983 RepID=UPI001CC51101|nr:uncharacterized protein LOC110599881 isoform X4 [Manihot esculenta]